jgi:AcrR family transcriptional regulator
LIITTSETTAPTTAHEPAAKARPHRARRGEGDRLRDEILDATEALILQSGNADAVSIRQVAQAIDRTPPSIYLHFSTKDALMQAVCQRQFDAMTERFRAVIEGVDDPVEQIRLMAHEYGAFALEHPEQYRVLFMSGIRTEAHDLDALRLRDCFGMLVVSVETALQQGRFVPGDPILISLALWAAVHGVASLLIAHDLEFPPFDVYLGQVVEQNLWGLLAR